MGLFSKIFGPSEIKTRLETLYVPMLQELLGVTLSQARSTFNDLYKQAEREAKKEGTINLPIDSGDILLEKEATRQETKSLLDKLRKEGVRNEDIRWWMNRHELDRKMMIKMDDASRFALFLKLTQKDHLSEEEAAQEVKMNFPIFGDSDDTSPSHGDDRPLPLELKNRIDTYVQKRSQTHPDEYKIDISKSSSFNALIRREIRAGHL